MRAIGVGSYSLYLWQQVFLNPGKTAFINRFPQNLILACLAAAASYLLIERPFLRLKEKLARRRPASAPVPVAVAAGACGP